MRWLPLLLACAGGHPAAEPALPAPVLPDPGGALAPALTRIDSYGAREHVDTDALTDTSSCAGCHPAQAAEWAESAHARASFDNPWYRASVESFRDGAGRDASRMCAGCHDLALLVDGAMAAPVQPTDPRAHAGVGCLACHGPAAAGDGARPDGNGSISLVAPVLPVGDDATAHVAAMGGPGLRQAVLCVACHRGFLSAATGHAAQLSGMDEGGPWASSPWAGSRATVLEEPVAERTCVDCHMQHGHRFPGGQTALAAQVGPQALQATLDMLRQAATLHVASAWIDGRPLTPDAARPAPGATVEVDVVVHNDRTGHAFPAGLKDTQDLRLEIELHDATGQRLGATAPWRLGTLVLDEAGQPEWGHRAERFAGTVADSTVPARGARAVRVTLALPADLPPQALPLSIEARLVHVRHVQGLASLACAAGDEAWQAASIAAGRAPLDACAPQPAHVIARARQVLGQGPPPTWQARYAHALALVEDRTEALPRARAAIDTLAPSTTWQQAQVHWLRARVAGRQGRVEQALGEVAAAEALVGAHPALDRARGDALARVWRWPEAQAAYAQVAAAAPRDTRAWRDLARAAGSAGDARRALQAATRGLQAAPRDAELLRSQALALRSLGLPDAEATSAWLAARGPDDADALAATCERTVPGCRAWRQPIPALPLDLTPAALVARPRTERR